MAFDMDEDPILPMSELRLATNNFSEENLMKQTPSVVLYKGLLTQSAGQSIPIVVRRYTNPDVQLNEAAISLFHIHKNIATLFKVASEDLADDDDDFDELDDDTRIKVLSKGYLIYKYEVNESLDKHLSGSTLTWMQRLNICVDLARALCYIHHELPEDHSMIHGNIKSSKILLNQNWEPTLHGLRADMMIKKHGVHHPSNYDGKLQYTDPAYEKTKALNHKSDVYSFGVVLFEVLLGRVASIPISNEDNWSFARFARSHYERETLSDIIDPVLRQQMDRQSLKIFSETAYYCLLESRSQRPDMIMVVKKLESALNYQQKLESPEHSTTAAVEAPLSDQLKLKSLTLEDGNKTDGKEVKLEDVGKQGKEEGSTSRPKEWQYLEISLEEIKQAAKNFQDCIGKGGYGLVYRGKLYKSGKPIPVAIKRLNEQFGQGLKEFLNEIQLLNRKKHPNLISLIGYCEEDKEKILVYEYAQRGSLDRYLRRDNTTNYTLTWHQRLKICTGVARGLDHLHHHFGKHVCIIHRDIKSANILLDENWVAKISDFGLSKLSLTGLDRSNVISHPCGTMGYCEPEYMITGILTKESDVYSFGMVLFEVLCGRLCTIKDNDGILLSGPLAKEFYERKRLEEIIDPSLKEHFSSDSVNRFSEIAYRCLHYDRKQRPPMDLVVKELEHLLEMEV